MKIVNKYSNYEIPCGESFDMPSITCPDLSFSVNQLIAQYSVGNLPPLARLQFEYDDDEALTAINDLKHLDLTDLERSNNTTLALKEIIKEKVANMRKWKAEHTE